MIAAARSINAGPCSPPRKGEGSLVPGREVQGAADGGGHAGEVVFVLEGVEARGVAASGDAAEPGAELPGVVHHAAFGDQRLGVAGAHPAWQPAWDHLLAVANRNQQARRRHAALDPTDERRLVFQHRAVVPPDRGAGRHVAGVGAWLVEQGVEHEKTAQRIAEQRRAAGIDLVRRGDRRAQLLGEEAAKLGRATEVLGAERRDAWPLRHGLGGRRRGQVAEPQHLNLQRRGAVADADHQSGRAGEGVHRAHGRGDREGHVAVEDHQQRVASLGRRQRRREHEDAVGAAADLRGQVELGRPGQGDRLRRRRRLAFDRLGFHHALATFTLPLTVARISSTQASPSPGAALAARSDCTRPLRVEMSSRAATPAGTPTDTRPETVLARTRPWSARWTSTLPEAVKASRLSPARSTSMLPCAVVKRAEPPMSPTLALPAAVTMVAFAPILPTVTLPAPVLVSSEPLTVAISTLPAPVWALASAQSSSFTEPAPVLAVILPSLPRVSTPPAPMERQASLPTGRLMRASIGPQLRNSESETLGPRTTISSPSWATSASATQAIAPLSPRGAERSMSVVAVWLAVTVIWPFGTSTRRRVGAGVWK